MSDVMLHGVLEMPPELWSGTALDVIQRHSRYMQASERIRQDAETIRALSERLARVEADAERYRFMRDNDLGDAAWNILCGHQGVELDEAVDEAIRAGK